MAIKKWMVPVNLFHDASRTEVFTVEANTERKAIMFAKDAAIRKHGKNCFPQPGTPKLVDDAAENSNDTSYSMQTFECKLTQRMTTEEAGALAYEAIRRGVSVCDGCCYDITECSHSNTIHVGGEGYKLIDRDKKLPVARAWCRECRDNIAIPKYYVQYHGGRGILLECPKCHSKYAMYECDYTFNYVGTHTHIGYIPPTHGKSIRQLSRDVTDRLDRNREKRQAEYDKELASKFGISVGELEQIREKAKARDKVLSRKYADDTLKQYQESQNKLRKDVAEIKKRLISEGVIVYDKKNKCLVDTRTGKRVNY